MSRRVAALRTFKQMLVCLAESVQIAQSTATTERGRNEVRGDGRMLGGMRVALRPHKYNTLGK